MRFRNLDLWILLGESLVVAGATWISPGLGLMVLGLIVWWEAS